MRARPTSRRGLGICYETRVSAPQVFILSRSAARRVHAPHAVFAHAAVPRSDWPCGLARPLCGASPRRQFYHPIVAIVGDIDVAGGIHRHTAGVVESGEGQLGRGGRARRQFHHPIVGRVRDVEVASGIHRHPDGVVEAGERQDGLPSRRVTSRRCRPQNKATPSRSAAPLAVLAAFLDRLGRYEPAGHHRGVRVRASHRSMGPRDQHRDHPPAGSSRQRGLRIAGPRGRNDDHRRHGDLRIRPDRPGPNRTRTPAIQVTGPSR